MHKHPSTPLLALLPIAVLFFATGTPLIYGQSGNLFGVYEKALTSREQAVVQTLTEMPATKRLKVASIDPVSFRAQVVNANLFDDAQYEFRKQTLSGRTQFNSWCGETENSPGSAAFLINQSRVSGLISSPEGRFELIPLNDNGGHVIIEYQSDQFGGCGNNNRDPLQLDDQQSPPINKRKNKPSVRSIDQSECVVRLLIGYTPAAKENTMSVYNRTMVEHVNLAVLLMNQSYVNSQVDQRVELAFLYEVSDEESENSTEDVNALRDSTDGRWDEIHEYRDQFSADLVALITGGFYTGECGRAYGFNYDEESDMFQVSEYNCAVSNLTLAHEFGHLQGCRHEIDGSTIPFEFGHGYNQGGYYRTIMAVCCGEERLNYWSNPYIYYESVGPMGTLNFNNNAQALNISYPVVADHRMNPDNLTSETMLLTDHAITGTTMGDVHSSDTTMLDGSLIFQSESKITLTSGFKAYNGSMGKFMIIDGCDDITPIKEQNTTKPLQRDAPAKTVSRPTSTSDNALSRDRD